MPNPLSMLAAVVLIVAAALCGLWLGLGWTLTINGEAQPIIVPVLALILSAIAGLGLAVEAIQRRRSAEVLSDLAPGRRSPTREASRKPGVKFTVRTGRRYKAIISLGFFEQMASNDMIAEKLEEAGFKSVKVTGNGATREAEAVWSGQDTTAEMPPQLVSAVELPDATPPAFAQAGAAAAPLPASAPATTAQPAPKPPGAPA